MNDGLKQISDYIKSITAKADRSLKRPVPPETSLERIRDVFDASTSMKAEIKTPSSVSRIMMDLNFGPRLGTVGCCADCICGLTESFTYDVLVDGSLYLSHAYVAGSVNVYIDGNRATRGVDYIESGPEIKQIDIITPGTNIVVSYVYNLGNCQAAEFPCGFLNWPEASVFSGNQIVFSDRFDREPGFSAAPTGHCGRWVVAGDGTPPFTDYPVPVFETGLGEVVGGAAMVGGVGYVTGKSFEAVAAIDMTDWGTNGSIYNWSFEFLSAATGISGYPNSPFFFLSGSTLSVHAGAWAIPEVRDPDDSSNLVTLNGQKSTTIDLTTLATTVYVRMAQSELLGWTIRIWPQNGVEPSSWTLQLTEFEFDLSTLPADYAIYESWNPILERVAVTCRALQAFQVWAGTDTGGWSGLNGFGLEKPGWQLDICRTYTGGEVRFGFCDPASTDISPIGSSSATSRPTTAVGISFPHFVTGGTGLCTGTAQKIYTLNTSDGKPATVRLKGQIRLSFGGGSGIGGTPSGNFYRGLHAVFYTYPGRYDIAPTTGQSWFVGASHKSVFVPSGARGADDSGGIPEWIDFEVDLPTDDGVLRWGIQFGEEPSEIAQMPDHPINGGFLQPNNGSVGFIFRDVTWYALSNTHCSAPAVCPDLEGGESRGLVAELEA
jgi:hypothetical protein